MPKFSFLAALRQLFRTRTPESVKKPRLLQLTQLEDRRMLNASFVFAPTPNPSPPQNSSALTLNSFDAADGNLTVTAGTMSNGDAAYVFSLDNNTWDGITTPLLAEIGRAHV